MVNESGNLTFVLVQNNCICRRPKV